MEPDFALRISAGVVHGIRLASQLKGAGRSHIREVWLDGYTAVTGTGMGRGDTLLFFKPTPEARRILKQSRYKWREWTYTKMWAVTKEWWSE